MPTLGSSVLILGYHPESSLQIGADFVKEWDSSSSLSERTYDVICTNLQEVRKPSFDKLVHRLKTKNPMLQMLILADESDSIPELQKAFSQYPVFRISNAVQWNLIEKDLVYCLEEAQMSKQELELESLVHQQNEKLKQLYQELEDRVQKDKIFFWRPGKKLISPMRDGNHCEKP